MACICNNGVDCTQEIVEGVTYCTCTTTISNINCPEGCTTIITEDGNAVCQCTEQIEPTIIEDKIPLYFDNEEYFKDVSWTISYKVTEGSWNSYFSFYPDFTVYHNNFFQVGYNWGEDKETMWNHLMNRSSFCVFQGKKHIPIIEFPVISENTEKMLNSISLNIEGVHYQNDWDSVSDITKSFKNLFIFNQTNCSGLLSLNPQKTLSDNRKYPITNGNIQEILFTPDQGKHNINYFYNRTINDRNNIPMFLTDENNIFKTINTNAVKFGGKKVMERMKGEWFLINLSGCDDSRYNLILKNIINNETVEI